LATKPDKTIWHWESKDGNRAITVTPSVLGRATQFDKDLLIYVVSQMTEALNRERVAQTVGNHWSGSANIDGIIACKAWIPAVEMRREIVVEHCGAHL